MQEMSYTKTQPALKYLRKAFGLLGPTAVVALACLPAVARDDHDRDGRYQQVNLVSDVPGLAMIQDTNLVNAWGISFSPTSPFWISDNATGLSTLYSVTNDSEGVVHVTKLGLEVSIPGEGNPTGQVFNHTPAFHGNPFIFASEDGTISGWRGALGATAETLVTRSNAVYKGIAIGTNANGPLLLAADFSGGTVDAYDGNLNPVARFSDPDAPVGYAPFNVQLVGGMIFVTFAKQDDRKHDDSPGQGHGLIAVLNPQTGMFHRFAAGSDAGGRLHQIDSPWGVALAPNGFGEQGDRLLVGNFGSGTIMAFDAHGRFRGLLKGGDGRPIAIEGLWGLAFGNGGRGGDTNKLYFTAGPAGESHGLFGSLEAIAEHEHRHGHGHGEDHD